MIAPSTPIASRTTREFPTSSSQTISSISLAAAANWLAGSPTWMILLSFSGIPSSWAIVAATSSLRSPSPAAIALSRPARSSREVSDQAGKAARAAATARSASSAEQAGIVPMTSSVVELITSIGSEPCGCTHSPPMKILSLV